MLVRAGGAGEMKNADIKSALPLWAESISGLYQDFKLAVMSPMIYRLARPTVESNVNDISRSFFPTILNLKDVFMHLSILELQNVEDKRTDWRREK